MNFSGRTLSVFVFAALLLGACAKKGEVVKDTAPVVEGDRIVLAAAENAATFLKVAPVVEDRGSLLRLPGRLVWNEDRTVRIYPQLAGRVVRVMADLGSEVRAGQALAVLSSPDFGVAQAELKKAQADAALSRKAFERSRELLAAGVMAAKDAEQVEADFARAQAEAERAASRLALFGRGGASVDQSYALSSPIAGTVVERVLNVGQELRSDPSGAAPFVVTDPASLWIQIDAAEADLAALRTGVEFGLQVRQFPGEVFPGRIVRIADFVDPVARTVKVRGVVPNAGRRLKAEMFATATIALPSSVHPMVPSKAVFLVGAERFVFVEVSPGTYLRRKVEVGVDRDGFYEVRAGLRTGEQVVVEGNLHLLKFFNLPNGADDK